MTIPLVDLGPLLDLAASVPELATELAPSTHPLALLPVRLETRFVGRPDGTSELRVRVFPDQIHIDAHDPRLSAEEVAWGERYWNLQWRAGSEGPRLRSAWRMLTDRFEPGRAAWIARRMQPTNAGERPTSAIGEDEPLARPPRFPDLGEPAAVVRTPRARALPSRWTATAYRDGRVVAVATGREIVDDLAVGPDPDEALAPADDNPATLAIDDGMRWMVDFERAEAVGMALRLALPEPVESAAVDVLLVAGVAGGTAGDGAERLAALLDAHHYSDGLAFLAPRTPTNNSAEERAGYVSRDRRGELSFAVEWPDAPPDRGRHHRRRTARHRAGAPRRRSELHARTRRRRHGRRRTAGRGDPDRPLACHMGVLPVAVRGHRRPGRTRLGPRSRPAPPAPSRSPADAALRAPALWHPARDLAGWLDRHRRRHRSRRGVAPPARRAPGSGLATGRRFSRKGRSDAQPRRRPRRRVAHRRRQRRVRRPPGARPALPPPPPPAARRGPRRAWLLRSPATADAGVARASRAHLGAVTVAGRARRPGRTRHGAARAPARGRLGICARAAGQRSGRPRCAGTRPGRAAAPRAAPTRAVARACRRRGASARRSGPAPCPAARRRRADRSRHRAGAERHLGVAAEPAGARCQPPADDRRAPAAAERRLGAGGPLARRVPRRARRARRSRPRGGRAPAVPGPRCHLLPARRLGHVTRDAPAGGDPRRAADRSAHRRVRLAREPAVRGWHTDRHTAAGRAGPAVRRRRRPRFHRGAVADPGQHGGAVAHRPSGPRRWRRQPVRRQAHVRSGAPRRAAVRRGAPGPVARDVARLRRGAAAARGRPRGVHRRPAAVRATRWGGRRRGGQTPARVGRAAAARGVAHHPGPRVRPPGRAAPVGSSARTRSPACCPGSTPPSTPPPTQ